MSSESEKPTCGIVMPISAIDGCTESHWQEVYKIIESAVNEAGLDARLVSDDIDAGIIQQAIVQNLYQDPIVICDVSAKNPNVMFELGMRLAFDKPTIIVKDNSTDYSFDTSPLRHVEYPRDLRYASMIRFKDQLKDKILGTLEKANTDDNYSPFLKAFGEFTTLKIDSKEVDSNQFILQELKKLKTAVADLGRRTNPLQSDIINATDQGLKYSNAGTLQPLGGLQMSPNMAAEFDISKLRESGFNTDNLDHILNNKDSKFHLTAIGQNSNKKDFVTLHLRSTMPQSTESAAMALASIFNNTLNLKHKYYANDFTIIPI